MGKRTRTLAATGRAQYAVEARWTKADLALLGELKRAEACLPDDAPRALLSVRLSVLTNDTTSPARQELDLRKLALERGCRVVGVASDLNVSATKVPPWKRKELGDWLNNRAPEFDEILFWKLDRFVRRLTDLSAVIDWCLKYGKNLVSRNDSIDLTTTAGKNMATIIGGIAEIEATNTSTRVASLWDYAKTQNEWLVGKPAYGYETTEGEYGRVALVIKAGCVPGTALVPGSRHACTAGVSPPHGQGPRTSRSLRTRAHGLDTAPTPQEPCPHGLPRRGGQERRRTPLENRPRQHCSAHPCGRPDLHRGRVQQPSGGP